MLAPRSADSGQRTADSGARYTVGLCCAYALALGDAFAQGRFDLVFHSLFKHHLPVTARAGFDQTVTSVARNVFEYDGCRSWLLILGPYTRNGWRDPVLLNGSILSALRYPRGRVLRGADDGWTLRFTRIGTYLRAHVNA